MGGGGSGGGGGGGRVSGPPTRSKSGRTKAQSQTNVGFGAERISTQKAKAQISAKQSEFGKSLMGKVPGMSMAMGNLSLAAQQKALAEGGTAVAVPGTSFAPQGQAYSQEPGQLSKSFQSQMSATKPDAGSGKGYVGDVAGVTKTTEIMGIPVTTFTGKTGYSPTGQQVDTADKGGKGDAPTVTVTEPEVTPEVTPEVVPDDTVLASTRRRTRFKRSGAGGTILEGFGALYS